MYSIHPSAELNSRFAEKPYQGVEPSRAKFLFVGLDANYAEDIAEQSVFPKLLEYHSDGVAFWRKYGVHHPFLLTEYKGGGRKYHASFAQIGFSQRQADEVSFVELLHVPTIGRNPLDTTDLDAGHLAMVNSAIVEGANKHVFVSAGVARLMRASGRFDWLPPAPRTGSPLAIWFSSAACTVHSHLHLSAYGKFQEQKTLEAAAIRTMLSE